MLNVLSRHETGKPINMPRDLIIQLTARLTDGISVDRTEDRNANRGASRWRPRRREVSRPRRTENGLFVQEPRVLQREHGPRNF